MINESYTGNELLRQAFHTSRATQISAPLQALTDLSASRVSRTCSTARLSWRRHFVSLRNQGEAAALRANEMQPLACSSRIITNLSGKQNDKNLIRTHECVEFKFVPADMITRTRQVFLGNRLHNQTNYDRPNTQKAKELG